MSIIKHDKLMIICQQYNEHNKLLILIFVIISPDYAQKRIRIRNTWGTVRFSNEIKIIFSVGLSKKAHVNEEIEREHQTYNDILQGDFIDDFFTMTTKIMMSFYCASQNCPYTHFVLRINDDVIANLIHLKDFLLSYLENSHNSLKNMIFGKMQTQSLIMIVTILQILYIL